MTSRDSPLSIPSLDGLRAVSFFIVFLQHAGAPWVPGGFGVTVFFFLSGYLITTLMRLEAERTDTLSLRRFYARRALRILPPFYLVLAVATTLAALGVLPGGVRLSTVAAQALHVSNYWAGLYGTSGQPLGTVVYWSLAVEEHFYLVFPWVFLFMHRSRLSSRQKATLLWSLCALVLAWRCVRILVNHADPIRVTYDTDTRLDSMLFGCALAVHRNPAIESEARTYGMAWRRVWLPVGLAILVVSMALPGAALRETVRYSLQGLGLYPVFIASILWPGWGVFRALNLRGVRFIGTLSYSLYLVHDVAFELVSPHVHGHPFVAGAAALALAFAAAWLVWAFVERPCARLRRRLEAVPTSQGVRSVPAPG